jgi:hypothetical protein
MEKPIGYIADTELSLFSYAPGDELLAYLDSLG